MKEMTTAEFGKAKLDSLTEPVKIRRYTKAVGTYYPEGFQPKAETALDPVWATAAADAELFQAQKVIEEKNEEIARLKKLLAAKMESFEAIQKHTATEAVAYTSKDVFASLPKQDREFFERKLGKKK